MFPYFVLFGKMITTYFLMALIGMLAAGAFCCYVARKRGYDDNDVIIVLLFASVGVLLGGHVLYGLTNITRIPSLFAAQDLSQFLKHAQTIFGGSVFYGGLFGGIIAASICIRVKKLEFATYSDMLTLAIPLFHFFARIGCFLGGCCYGIECEFGILVTGNDLVPGINGVPRFPVQLLEAMLNLGLFFVLYGIYKRSITHKNLQGSLLIRYLISYSVIRFFDEFLRDDEIRGFIFGVSTSQFISIILFAVSGIIWIALHIKKSKGFIATE